jgi:serine/threonine-protein kinase
MTGRIIGHYRIIDKLGEGGMGKVYRAIDTMVEREVAMKSLKRELASRPEVLERFRTEATTLARLNHPNVAQLYSFFPDGNEFFMVMEFVPGRTLETAIQESGAMPWQKALEIAAQVLDGIHHAHQLGILHRDIKPSNIVLLDPGKGTGGFQPAAKIMDFGIAQALGSSRLTREGHLIGTLEYLAPERIQGKTADARSDLYSMAIVLYEMLTGKLPFSSNSEYSLLLAQVQQQPPRPRDTVPDLPPAVEQTLLRGLEKDPARRFPDAASFAATLRRHLSAPPSTASSSTVHAALQIDQFFAELASIFWDLPPFPQLVSRFGRALTMAWRDKTFRVVTVCGLVLLVALSGLLLAVLVHRAQGPAVEVAATDPAENQPQAAERSPQAQPSPVQETPILPSSPIPIGQILGGGNVDGGTASPAPESTPAGETTPAGRPATVSPGTARPGSNAVTSQPPSAPWEAVNAALDTTDGPVTGKAGEWPIHRAGLVSALRMAGTHWRPEILRELNRRGVNFLLTPSTELSLRQAGADDALVNAVSQNLRSAPLAPTNPPVAPKPPEPSARIVSRLSEVKTLYIERMKGDLDELLRQKINEDLDGRIKLVSNAASADARMTAQMEADEGGLLSGAGRVFGLKDKYRVTIRILATANSRELWQHTAGDRSPIVGALGSRAMSRAVSRIVGQLEDDLK